MNIVPKLTRGRLTATWVVLKSADKLGRVVNKAELVSFARKSGLRAGGLPISDGLQLAVLGEFLSGDDVLSITGLGSDVLSRCGEEEPSPEVLRVFLSVFLLRFPPAWVPYWQGDNSSLDVVLPDATKDLIEDARIPKDPSPGDIEMWALWDALTIVPQTEAVAAMRKAVGDAGEALSFAYETARLNSEGYPELAGTIRWVARESPAYGFDILSFCGRTFHGSPERPLAIEVKAQSLVARPSFSLYISKHEWDTANLLGQGHIFHLWDGVSGSGDSVAAARSRPNILRCTDFAVHMPKSPQCGDRCDWQSTAVTVKI